MWLGHVTHKNVRGCHWFNARGIRKSHVTCEETYEWVMTRGMSHVTCEGMPLIQRSRNTKESCHMWGDIRMSHVTCEESCHIWGDIRLSYGVATISRLLQIIGLFCRISSLLKGSFAKETYYFKEPTNHSHPICHMWVVMSHMGWLRLVGSLKL